MKRLLRRELLFSLVITLVGLLLLELAARWLIARNMPEPAVPASIGQFDSRLGWSLKPLAHAISRRTGQPVEYRINSQGLRGPETTYEKPAGVFRIVLLGDSRTFGFGVPIAQHYSTLLAGYFDKVEVINLGTSGYGVDQELLFLEYEGFRYRPDLVIAYVAHYSNQRHMYTERFGKQKPRFVLKDGKLTLTNSPVPSPAADAQPASAPKQIHRWLADQSVLYRIIVAGALQAIRPTAPPASSAPGEEMSETPEAFVREMLELGAAIVFEMHDASARRGAQFVLVTQIPELHDAALRRSLPSLDVTSALANRAFDLPDDLGHINEAGNGALAWEIAAFLVRERLIPAAHPTPTRSQEP
ncbi:MAG: hypothetical protein FJ011_17040 [Chloroflexi bacterium]|nr:hypothetical protein [Chloroflexota bacterium]